MSSDGAVRARLRRAEHEHEGVKVLRAMKGVGLIEGYVVGVGKKWALLANVPSHRLDGYLAFRLRDVERIQPLRSHDFYRALATATGAWPPAAPGLPIDLDTTRGLIETVHTAGTIINLQIEYQDPDVAFLGVPAQLGARSAMMYEVSPQAVWDGTLSRWRYRDVSRIEFSSAYENDLLSIAGPPPASA